MNFYEIKNILVPLDFSKTSMKALDYALMISRVTNADIILLHVIPAIYQPIETNYFTPVPIQTFNDFEDEFVEQSNKHLDSIAENLKKKGISNVLTFTSVGNVHSEVLKIVKVHDVSLIIMGTHGVSGVREFFMGSNTFRIIRDSKCPVLSIPLSGKVNQFKNILLPYRDKPHSREKTNYAIEFAKLFSSAIHILGIDTEFTKAHKKKIQLEGVQIKTTIKNNDIASKLKIISDVYLGNVVLKYAKSVNADLIISMADLDKMNIIEYFTGPYAQQIVNHSSIPVLSIRPKFNTDTIDLRFY